MLGSKSIITYILLIAINSALISQDKSGYNWVYGENTSSDPGLEGIVMSFNNDSVTYTVEDFEDGVKANVSVISDPDGNLLFYATGCRVYNKDFQIMTNGDSLNYGVIWDEFCNGGFYPMLQSTLILPDYHVSDQYYLFHKKEDFDTITNEFATKKLLYSIIDMSADGGRGAIVEKGIVLDTSNYFITSTIEAVKHENKLDWWILQLSDRSDSIRTYLVDELGPRKSRKQYINTNIPVERCGSTSQSCFDLRGRQYAIYCPSYGLDVYNFERSTGVLSNHKHLAQTQSQGTFSGLAWSPSGQYLYISASDTLWQVDTHAENLQDGLELIAEYDGFASPFAVNFVKMQIGPNCKIYVSSQSSVQHFSVINSPDEKGQDCDFVQHGIELPYIVPPVPLPNVPNFAIDEEEVCDPTITSVFDIPVTVQTDQIKIAPNPTNGMTTVHFTEKSTGHYSLFDHSGQLITSDVFGESQSLALDLSTFHDGLYYIRICDEHNGCVTEKLVVVD